MNIQPQDSVSFQMNCGQWPAPLPNQQDFFVLTPTAVGVCYGSLQLYENNNLVNSLEFKLTVDPPTGQTSENQGLSTVAPISPVTVTETSSQTPVIINVNVEVFGVSAVSISLVAIISVALWKRVAKHSDS